MNMTNLPFIPILENEELWTQKAIDQPELELEELKLLKQQFQKVYVSKQSTATEPLEKP
jgi:hypothetical protein